MEIVAKKVFEFAPQAIVRLILGGFILGVVLLIFLKVADSRFGLSQRQLDLLGLMSTPILALLLCGDIQPLQKKMFSFFAASLVIFAVGFATNQIVVDLKEIFLAPAIPNLEEIQGS